MAPLLHRAAIKSRDAQKQQTSGGVRGVSAEAGRKSMVGKICESAGVGFQPGVKE